MTPQILAVLAACVLVIDANNLVAGQDCTVDFKVCAPPGATADSLGPIGSGWANLYMSIVDVVTDYAIDDDPPATTTVDPNGPARRKQAFCCKCFLRSSEDC